MQNICSPHDIVNLFYISRLYLYTHSHRDSTFRQTFKKAKPKLTIYMRRLSVSAVLACLQQRVPANDFLCYDISSLLDEDSQRQIHQLLVEIAKTNPFYVKVFLSRYIRLLESQTDVAEELYELVCDSSILGATEPSATATDVLRYGVGSKATVAIRENPKVISCHGTTGLRTWEAALYLLNMLNTPGALGPLDLKGRRIVELGAGTGLVSLALLQQKDVHQFSHIIVTDGDTALVENLQPTFALNGVQLHRGDKDDGAEGQADEMQSGNLCGSEPCAFAQQLLWGTTNRQSSSFIQEAPQADIVVAADVTYDKLIVPQLCDTIGDFLVGGTTAVFVAATVRNLETLEVWEKELDRRFVWRTQCVASDPHLLEMDCWFKKGTPEIRIYHISGVISRVEAS